jgi:hypothetical protein
LVAVIGIPFSLGSGTAQAGGTVSATWSSLFAPNGGDFVGLYTPGAPNSSPLTRVFTNGTGSPGGAGTGAGSVSLSIPANLPAGLHEARLVSGSSGGTLAKVSLALPTAANDSYSVAASTPLSVPAPGVLANDAAANGQPLMATTVTPPAHGTLSLQPNGAFSYTPSQGFAGTDRFTYQATDPSGLPALATVTIIVTSPGGTPTPPGGTPTPPGGTPVACGPRPSVQVQTAAANGALQVTISASDVDGPTQNRLREIRFAAPVNGRVMLNGQSETGAFTHTPPAGTTQVSFSVQRVTPGQATTVPLTVVDECGTWPTLVGGGTAAGF